MIRKYDVLVLGSGPAGFYSALTCAGGGLKTAIVEKSLPGGTGFATGCLPVKLLLDRIRQNRNSIFSNENSGRLSGHPSEVSELQRERLSTAGVDFFQSDGEFSSRNIYRINHSEIEADKIIIATGSEPACIEGSSFSSRIISHKEAVSLKSVPDNLLIVGGDVEGIEFASLFSQLGSKVTVVEQLPEILPGYDRDLVQPLKEELIRKNVEIICSSRVMSLDEQSCSVTVDLQDSKIEAEIVLITGLRKNSIPIGLCELGLKIENEVITVNNNLESSLPGIFAVGDINGLMPMAGAAIQQAVQLGDFLTKGIAVNLDYSILPRAVFTIPQICGGGLQEKEITNLHHKYSVKSFPLNKNWRSMYKSGSDDFVKVISDKAGVIRGIWFSGFNVESHGGAAGLILNQELTIHELRRSLYIHPTDFESIFEAGLL